MLYLIEFRGTGWVGELREEHGSNPIVAVGPEETPYLALSALRKYEERAKGETNLTVSRS